MRKAIICAFSALFIVGACASGPDYAPAANADAVGYSDQRIETDRWRVSYRGDTKMSSADVQDYALMRAAQLTLETTATGSRSSPPTRTPTQSAAIRPRPITSHSSPCSNHAGFSVAAAGSCPS